MLEAQSYNPGIIKPAKAMKIFQAGLLLSILFLLGQIGLVAFLPAEAQANANKAAILLASLLSILVVGYSAWQTRLYQPKLFPSWLLLAIAMSINPLAGIFGGIVLLVSGGTSSLSFIQYFVLLIYPLLFLMVALLPSRSTRRLELIQWVFDALVVVFSTTLIFWVFIIQPDLLAAFANLEQVVLSLAYQVGDLLILWSLAMIIFRRISEQRSGPLWWLFGAFLILLIYDLLTSANNPSANPGSYSSLKEVLLTASILFVAIAGLRQLTTYHRPQKGSGGLTKAPMWEEIRLIMPYIGLGLSFGVLVVSIITPQSLSTLAIAIWVALILLLVTIRQALVIRENQRLSDQLFLLNTELEQRVSDRTRALFNANQELMGREILLAHNALHDSLTDLPNRTLLIDRLEQSIKRMRRDPNYAFGVLFLDLDNFKVINDSMGHLTGDKLLVKIAGLLKSCMRDIDTVARLGGDEFVVLVDNCSSGEFLVDVAQRILGMFTEPIEINHQYAYIAASIGIVPGSTEYDEPSDILRDADLAMYEAKALGKARHVVFSPELRSDALDRLILEKDLRVALENRELFLNYQPIIDLANGSILGFEALLRWNHPGLGQVSPGIFIPIAETNAMIIPITYWVLEEAIRQLSIWNKKYSALSLTMSVNLSARVFSQPDLIQEINRFLTNAQLPPENLILEITESTIIQDTSTAVDLLQGCRKVGIQVHIDDFGTGYSSLSYLHNFPLNALKVAQDFVLRIQPGGENIEIVRTIVTLAHDLGLAVIAEGIETPAQMNYVRELGCQGGQGFLISRPLSPEQADQFIQDRA